MQSVTVLLSIINICYDENIRILYPIHDKINCDTFKQGFEPEQNRKPEKTVILVGTKTGTEPKKKYRFILVRYMFSHFGHRNKLHSFDITYNSFDATNFIPVTVDNQNFAGVSRYKNLLILIH